MACKKSELISAINSFAAARESGDRNLIGFSGELLGQFIEKLDFEPEEELKNDDQPEQSSEVV
jgi:hypothetical protein